MHRKALAHLRSADPALGAVIDKVGPFKLIARADGTHFDHVVRSIVGQQLSGPRVIQAEDEICADSG